MIYTIKTPLFSFIGGTLVNHGSVSFSLILGLSLFGHIAGDLFWYWSSRLSRKIKLIKKLKHKLGSDSDFKFKESLKLKPFKTFFIAKATPALPVPMLIYIGNTKAIKFKRFILYSSVISLILSLVFMLLGYFFGNILLGFYYRLESYSLILFLFSILIAYFVYKKMIVNKL